MDGWASNRVSKTPFTVRLSTRAEAHSLPTPPPIHPLTGLPNHQAPILHLLFLPTSIFPISPTPISYSGIT
ncbi:MAG: hypothetical protein IGS48_00560 [Oscillatoriales cyanobacterium C42_A2020_001]|nr:hypothetical protein [Leptolyngbyaceae cyanobacterium C42_A2020_001]